MSRYALEALLRPPVEFYSTVTASCGALICLTQAPLLMLTPWQARLMACALMLLAMRRGWQGWKIVRYHRNLLRLPRYALTSRKIPVSRQRLFLGKGFAGSPSTPRDCTTACNRKPHAGCSRDGVTAWQDTSKNAPNTLCPALPACSAPIAG